MLFKAGKGNKSRSGVLLLLFLFGLGLACLALPEIAAGQPIGEPPPAVPSDRVNEEWVRIYDEGSMDKTAGLAVDAQGNVYVTGTSQREVKVPNGSYYDYHFTTVKYSPAGQELWVRHYNSPGSKCDSATAMTVDRQGNIYVTGYNDDGYVTIKYDPHGTLLWESHHYEHWGQQPVALAVDHRGNVLVTGESSTPGTDYLTIKYSPDGEELWVRRYNGPANGYDAATAMRVDGQGNVYVTGTSWGSGTRYDYATIKYRPEGRQLWVRRYNGPRGNDWAEAIATDSRGNVYVTGASARSGTGYDYLTIKYNTEGRRLWVRRYNGRSNRHDYAQALALDSQSNVYVTGKSFKDASRDYTTIKYNPMGRQIWEVHNRGRGSYDYNALSMAVDSLGNVYVSGFDTYAGVWDIADYQTIKYIQNSRALR
jgi:uncharacterized delta-60 repeat protein